MIKFLFFIFLISTPLNGILIQPPKVLTTQEIEKLENESLEKGWAACFEYKNQKRLVFNYYNNTVEVILEFYGDFPKYIDEKIKKQFFKEERMIDGKKVFIYTLRVCSLVNQIQTQTNSSKDRYHVTQPRNFNDSSQENNPEKISVKQLLDLIETKTVVFYTGAGISAQAGVWTMQQLVDALGIDSTSNFDQCTQDVIENPQRLQEIFGQFCFKAFKASPTPAHYALTEIVLKKKTQILTENFDLLHEHAGIKALHISGPWLKKNVNPDELKNIDIVVCVALSYDDRGFLGWYKQNNPDGIIVAINLDKPPYLGNEDFFLQGDCQRILFELQQKL